MNIGMAASAWEAKGSPMSNTAAARKEDVFTGNSMRWVIEFYADERVANGLVTVATGGYVAPRRAAGEGTQAAKSIDQAANRRLHCAPRGTRQGTPRFVNCQ